MVKPRPKLLLKWVTDPPTAVEEIYLNGSEESESPLGQGFEVSLGSLWLEKENQQSSSCFTHLFPR